MAKTYLKDGHLRVARNEMQASALEWDGYRLVDPADVDIASLDREDQPTVDTVKDPAAGYDQDAVSSWEAEGGAAKSEQSDEDDEHAKRSAAAKKAAETRAANKAAAEDADNK
jgi:hypothetical protein